MERSGWGIGSALLFTAVAPWGCATQAPPRAPGIEVVNVPTRTHQLASGLRVTLERDPSHGVAGVALMIGVGGANEQAGTEGLAHLIEHLAFQSRRGDGQRLFRVLDEHGAFRGTTSDDSTTYAAFAPQSSLSVLLERFAGLIADPLAGVDERAFRHEQRVVTNELAFHREDSDSMPPIGWLSLELLPKKHPYAHFVGGTPASIARLDLGLARAFARQHYAANNATLLVSGNLNPNDVAGALGPAFAEHFTSANHQRRPPSAVPTAAPPTEKQKVVPRYEASSVDRAVWVGFTTPPEYGGEHALKLVVAGLIEEALRLGLEGCAGTAVMDLSQAAQGLLVVVALSPSTTPARLRNGLVRELRSRIAMLVSDASKLAEVKHAVATALAYDAESRFSRLLQGVADSHFTGDPLYRHKLSARIREVTADQVVAFAERYFTLETARAVDVEPGALAGAGTMVGVGTELEEEAGPAAALDPQRIRTLIPPLGLAATKMHTLPNGMTALILPRAGSPFHSAVLGFRSEATLEDDTLAAVASWSIRPDYEPLAEAAGLRLVGVPGRSLSVRSTGSDLSFSLGFIERHLRRYTLNWPTNGFYAARERIMAHEIAPARRAIEQIAEGLFPHHDRGRLVTFDRMNAVNIEQLRRWIPRAQAPERSLLVVVGDVVPSKALGSVQKTFADWGRATSGSERSAPVPLPAPRRDQELFVVQRDDTSRIHLTTGCRVVPFDAERLAAVELTRELWASELFRLLRGRLGAAYVTQVDMTYDSTFAALFARTTIDRGGLGEALAVFRGYLQGSRPLRVDGALLDAAKLAYAKQYWRRNETTLDVALRVVGTWQDGIPLALLDDWAEEILDVTVEDVENVWASCRQSLVVTAVGHSEEIRRAWDRAAPPQKAQ